MSWRTSQFEDFEEDSKIEIALNEDDGETELTLTHSNVPESCEHYIKGWDEHCFQPMKAYFEFRK